MNFRTTCLSALALAAFAAGCGDSTPTKFVDGEITKELHPQAAANLRLEMEKKFGTPREIVAAMAFSNENGLPIDFGRIEGTVLATETKLKDHQIAVEFTNLGGLKPEEFARLGLTFTSGGYQNATYDAPKADPRRGIEKGQAVAVFFGVLDYQPLAKTENRGILSLNYKLNQQTPPAAGDTFVLVGHRLRAGRRLYRQHCMHCHGYSGDGNGRTAEYLNPRPRDYRLGEFKFTSTRSKRKASRADLQHIVKKGIPGTYMPSFLMMFDEQESADVVEYVRWLAVRGEYEQFLGRAFIVNDSGNFSKDGWAEDKDAEENLKAFLADEFLRKIESNSKVLAMLWSTPQKPSEVVLPTKKRPAMTAASIARGRALFLSSKTNCWTCHGVSAKGDGPQTTSYQKIVGDPLADANAEYPQPGLYDAWGNRLKPRDLTKGIYRGGRRPLDLYRRIKIGIKGTPMPSFGTLTDDDIWDLVNYVLSVPLAKNGTLPAEQKHVSQAPSQ